MTDNSAHLSGTKEDLVRLIAELAHDHAERPGSIVSVVIHLPAEPTAGERAVLEEAVGIEFDVVNRQWTADFEYRRGCPAVEVGFSAPPPERDPNLPVVELVYPSPRGPLGSVRHQFEVGREYAVQRGPARADQAGIISLNLGSELISANPALFLSWDGTDILARRPEGGGNVSIVVDGEAYQVGPWRAALAAEQVSALVTGRFILPSDRGVVGVDIRVLPPGTRRTAFSQVTAREVEVVSKRRVVTHGMDRFVKTYECTTVTDAEQLARHFLDQQRIINEVNEMLRKRHAGDPVARNGLEETEVTQGVPPSYNVTAVVDTAVKDKTVTVTQPGRPMLQADHRVFVRTPYLQVYDWEQGRVQRLRDLQPIADALDELHARGAAHGDVKPSNVCLMGQMPPGAHVEVTWAVLVDTEGLSQPAGHVPWSGHHTPLYTHPRFRESGDAPPVGALIGNDRLGFAAVTVSALFGNNVARRVLASNHHGTRVFEMQAAVDPAWSWSQEGARRILDLLDKPFGDDQDLLAADDSGSWSCAAWLTSVRNAADEASRAEPDAPRPRDHVDEVTEGGRRVFEGNARQYRAERMAEYLHDEMVKAGAQVFRRIFLFGAASIVAVVALFVFVLMSGNQ